MNTMQDPSLQSFQAGLGFLLECNHAALDGQRRLSSLQSAVAGELEEAIAGATAAMRRATDVPSLISVQSDLWQHETERSLEYFRDLVELAEANRNTYQRLMDGAVTTLQSSLKGVLETAPVPPAATRLWQQMLDGSIEGFRAATAAARTAAARSEPPSVQLPVPAPSTTPAVVDEAASQKRRKQVEVE